MSVSCASAAKSAVVGKAKAPIMPEQCVAEALTGVWTGWSHPKSRPDAKTFWEGCRLTFSSASSNRTALSNRTCSTNSTSLAIGGGGTSVWDGERFKFSLSGSLDITTREFRLEKLHTSGKYAGKSHSYAGTLDTASRAFSGNSRSSVLTLRIAPRQRAQVPTPSERVKHPPGGPRPTVQTPDTAAATPMPLKKPSTPALSPAGAQPTDNSAPGNAKPSAAGSNGLDAKTLSQGVWSGSSTKLSSGEKTSWEHLELIFTARGEFKGYVRGKGVSTWRSRKIPFRVDGTYDAETRTGTLNKTHMGAKIRSSISYTFKITPPNEIEGYNQKSEFVLVRESGGSSAARASPYTPIESTQFVERKKQRQGSKPKITTGASTQASQYSDLTSVKWDPGSVQPDYFLGHVDALSEPKNAYAAYAPLIVGKGQSKSSRTSKEETKISTYQAADPDQMLPSPKPLNVPSGTGIRSKSSPPPVAHAPQLDEKYAGFLQGLILSETLDPTRLRALAEYQSKHNITEKAHTLTLKSLGITQAAFDAMKQNSGGDVEEDDLCKICYDREMNCALTPCGHMVCFECSKRIKACPVCRRRVFKVQRVFRT